MAIIGSSGNYRKFICENRRSIKLFSATLFYILFVSLGAYIFLVIESPLETAEKNAILTAKDSTLAKFPGVPAEAVDYFLKEMANNGVKGVTVNNTTRWTMGNSVLFAATLLTTIGYGHLSTSSVMGKIVCMFYTSLGIPFTLFILSSYVDRLHEVSDFFLDSLYHRLKSRLSMKQIRIIHFGIIFLFIVVACFLFPAYLFKCVEGSWSYFDAVYFCFITLTTVGLGDYVPGLNMKHPLVDLYRFGAVVFMFVGVTIMMFLLALMTDLVKNFNKPYQENMPPLLVSTEKLAICPDDRPPSYGTIIVKVANTYDSDETKALLP